MKRALVVGAGAGGATVAKELQGTYDVTVLEAGKEFIPLSAEIARLEKWKKTGLFLSERTIPLLFPAMKIRKTREHMVLVRGSGPGGTTTISTGNAVRMDQHLKSIGIDLDEEFEEIRREIPISTAHRDRWHPTTHRLFEACRDMGLRPQPMPKMVNFDKCTRCGRCIFGCPQNAKWDSRRFLDIAVRNGARLQAGWKAHRVVIRDGKAVGVDASSGLRRRFVPADLVVLAAGGFSTPVILENSGIPCEESLFVDPVLCVASEVPNGGQESEIQMPFVVQQDHFILSPYFDYLSFFFNRHWRFPASNTVGMMVKLADSNRGSVSGKGIDKPLTKEDQEHLQRSVSLCRDILKGIGAKEGTMFLGTLNAGHPGGSLPLTQNESEDLHNKRLPENVYVADATILPSSLGNPVILTIIALAKRVSKMCRLRSPGL
jgi:choline dehydrogenase-like flavoprotein